MSTDTKLSLVEQPQANAATTMLLAACAGGLAWGIRGQYGHETGAMVAGVLVGFVLVLLHGRHLSALQNAQAVALFALGISVGGSMTYGQTVGLTHDGPLVGNVEAYRWGMVGLGIKGAVWIGLGAAMFGMALSGKRYFGAELCWLLVFLIIALFFGVYAFNEPFDPEKRLLPKLYFSDHWHWEDGVDKPRRERWGGLVCVLAVLLLYLALFKRDALATALGLWGCIAGGIGFPAGQAVQAYHAWHSGWIGSLPTHVVTDYFNWWNMMETTFGCVFGAVVGFAVWLNRRLIRQQESLPADDKAVTWADAWPVEIALLALHTRLVIAWNFQSIPWLDQVADLALPMIVLPWILVVCGRTAAFWIAIPLTILPIAGKTLRNELPDASFDSLATVLDLYLAFPMIVAFAVTFAMWRWTQRQENAGWFATVGLIVTTWIYFLLNNAFFDSPWIWKPWTGRTVNGFLFLLFAILLTIAAAWYAPKPESDGVRD